MVSPLEGFTRQLKTELSACLSVNQWYWEIIRVEKIPKKQCLLAMLGIVSFS